MKFYFIQIIFEGKKAVGVAFTFKGKQYMTRVNKEVILSAGAVGTPKILMLSGVGPKAHLNSLQVRAVKVLFFIMLLLH